MKIANLLEGFEIVESDAIPTLTLDNQRRFYINTSARRLMGVKPYAKLSLAYRADDKSIAILKEGAGAYIADSATSVYSVDKRYYMSARRFCEKYGYVVGQAPYHFVYERGSSDGRAFVFRLQSAE